MNEQRIPIGELSGLAGEIVEVTAESISSFLPISVEMGGTPHQRTLHFKIPRSETVGVGNVPDGTIVMWGFPTIPDGWALCDGQNGTPDLRDRFIVGAGEKYSVGDVGGSDSVILTENQMPRHNHELTFGGSAAANLIRVLGANNAAGSSGVPVSIAGGDEAHENRPPYFALAYIIKIGENNNA
jgi:microcystin-dependent protein